MTEQFKKDVLEGLSKSPKQLSSKYFYDKIGDKLFQDIMAMPEYYLTRAEMDIFQNKTDQILNALKLDFNKEYDIIELGAGDGTKTFHLLKLLIESGYKFNYLPIDISQNALDGLKLDLLDKLSELSITIKQGTYFQVLDDIKKTSNPKVVLFLGSNLGNLDDHDAAKFLGQLSDSLNKNDKLILGLDLIKGKEIVLPAYNDKTGITRAFNLNLLDRINKELDGNFERNSFEHAPEYDEKSGIAKSFLKSLKNQSVTINGITFQFAAGELIQTETSRKYNDELLKQLLSKTELKWKYKIMDSNNLFADYILEKN